MIYCNSIASIFDRYYKKSNLLPILWHQVNNVNLIQLPINVHPSTLPVHTNSTLPSALFSAI